MKLDREFSPKSDCFIEGWGAAIAVGATVASAGAGAYEDSQAAGAEKAAIAPLQGAQDTLYSAAENIAATPYTPYTGQQVAGLTANQQQAITQASNASTNNEAQADIGNAEQQAAYIGGNTWNASTAAKYMNPYTQDVTNVALNQENQAYGAQENANNAAASSQGAFGGDRATLTDVATTGQHLQAQGNIEAEGMANAYANAQTAWQADNQRASTAAQTYEAAGNDITNMNTAQIQNLMATGTQAQQTAQLGLTTDYNNYLDQRAWPTNQLSALESAAGRTPTAAAVQPVNIATDVLGASSAIAGYMGKNNMLPGQQPTSINPTNYPQSSGTGGAVYDSNGMPTGLGTGYSSSSLGGTGSSLTGALSAGMGDDSDMLSGIESDPKLKRDIVRVGEDANGLGIYEYRYKYSWQRFRGYMADEVQKLFPDAVTKGPMGFLRVCYRKVPNGILMDTADTPMTDWMRDGVFA